MRLAIIATALIATIAASGIAPARAADPVTIRLAWVFVPASLGPLLFPKPELAPHRDVSYKFEPVHFASTAVEVTALASDQIDVANLSFSAIGSAIENAHLDDLRVFADEIQDGVHGVDSGAGFRVLTASPIQKVEDLKGKVIAVLTLGSATDMEVRTMLRHHGLEANRDYTLIEGGFGNMKDLLLAGKADMVSAVPPYSYDADFQAKSRVLFTATDSFGPIQLTAWTARAGFLAKNRAAMVDFMEDAIREVRWYMDPAHHREAVQIVADYTKQKPEEIDWLFTKKEFYRDPDNLPNLAALQSNLDTQQSLGLLAQKIDIAKYADLSITKEAAARVK
jgi:NitT/TauT family transport system substrate-binding protein